MDVAIIAAWKYMNIWIKFSYLFSTLPLIPTAPPESILNTSTTSLPSSIKDQPQTITSVTPQSEKEKRESSRKKRLARWKPVLCCLGWIFCCPMWTLGWAVMEHHLDDEDLRNDECYPCYSWFCFFTFIVFYAIFCSRLSANVVICT